MLNLLVFHRMPRPRAAGAPAHQDAWGYVANVYVLRLADAEGFARLVLSPSERSVPVYARAGFVPATTLMVRPGRSPR